MISTLDFSSSAIAEALTSGVAVVDSASRVALLNSAGARILGLITSDVVGSDLHTHLSPSDSPHLPDECPLCIAAAGERFHGRLLRFGKSGADARLVAVDACPLGAEGAVLSLVPAEESARQNRALREDIAERQRAAERREFLLESGRQLAASLNYETTLRRLARLAVPRLADWCAVDILTAEGQLERLAVEHIDPARVALAKRLEEQYPTDPNAPGGVPEVLRSGEAQLIAVVDHDLLARSARDEEHLRLIEELGMTSAMVVPLVARGRTQGAITLVLAESGRHFDALDLEFAEQFASRAALAVDNARLYLEARDARQRAAAINASLERQASELASANRELEAFSYSVSHDLRAPLRALDGFSRILLDEHAEGLSDDAVRYLDIIRTSAVQMGQLIDGLLRFSRLGRQPLSRHLVAVNPLVQQVLENLQPECEGRAVEIAVAELAPCQADATLLRQVFANLIANALKFTREREPARIEVGTFEKDGETVYFVKDNGVGFNMRYADKLFGVFQRLHRPEEYEGTGVGLAIVQRIVHRHGGRIWAEAEPRVGATFYFVLGA
ncbi:MAG TPA: ATP-binding protein [Chloroflexota bacterium]|nr:ATP-binding protein [Chloroflexota bacterium]